MRITRNILFVFVALLLAAAAHGQSGDWESVKQLPPGANISVKARHAFRTQCVFRGATDDRLVCELRTPFLPMLKLRRAEIREVRLERSDSANMATGAAIGAGAGAILGASTGNGSLTRGGGALLLGGVGGIAGGFFGRDFPIVHGKIIYRR